MKTGLKSVRYLVAYIYFGILIYILISDSEIETWLDDHSPDAAAQARSSFCLTFFIALNKYVFSLTLVLRFCACRYRCLICCFTRQGLAICFASTARCLSTTSLLKNELTIRHNIHFPSIRTTGMKEMIAKIIVVSTTFFLHLFY